MDKQQIHSIQREPIYKNNSIINLLNDSFYETYGNPILDKYLKHIKQFIEEIPMLPKHSNVYSKRVLKFNYRKLNYR